MTREEYWQKHVQIKGDGLDCDRCETRFNLGWNAAMKYGDDETKELLSDCQDVICHSVYLDDKAHLALMRRINKVIE